MAAVDPETCLGLGDYGRDDSGWWWRWRQWWDQQRALDEVATTANEAVTLTHCVLRCRGWCPCVSCLSTQVGRRHERNFARLSGVKPWHQGWHLQLSCLSMAKSSTGSDGGGDSHDEVAIVADEEVAVACGFVFSCCRHWGQVRGEVKRRRKERSARGFTLC